jgi:hypothetical protein
LRLQTETGYPITFYPAGAEAMRLTSTSLYTASTINVGIGTSLPKAPLHVVASAGAANDKTLIIQDKTAGNAGEAWLSFKTQESLDDERIKGAIVYANGGSDYGVGNLLFCMNSAADNSNATTANEKMRLDSSGNLLVGGTTTIGTGGKFQVTSSTDTSIFKCTANTTWAAIVSNVENTAARLMAFQYGSGGSPTGVGIITTDGTGVTYGTSSDYRLKENIAPMIGALDKVAQLKPVTYKWKANGSDGQGFIAHELKEVVPDAVQGEKDAVDEDGNPIYQGIDTSYLVATLTAAIQEQQALITQLTARITALEGA